MFPSVENESSIEILIIILICLGRLVYCSKKFDKDFMTDFLLVSIFTSIIWILFAYKSNKPYLWYQMFILILIYFCLILYFKIK